jgi:hypothetical protein
MTVSFGMPQVSHRSVPSATLWKFKLHHYPQCGKDDRPSHRVHYLEEQEIALKHPSTDYGCELRNLVGKASQIRFNMLHPME